MDATIATLSQHSSWMRSYLSGSTQTQVPDVSDDYELIDAVSLSDYDIQSLADDINAINSDTTSDTYSTTNSFADSCISCGCTLCFPPPLAEGPNTPDIWSSDVSRKEAAAFEIAGRHDGHTFKDLRSGAKARRRDKTRREKYFDFTSVKPGDLGKLHYENKWNFLQPARTLLHETTPVVMTKRNLYEQAQLWPRPPTYHRRLGSKDHDPWSARVETRRAARKHAFDEAEAALKDAEHTNHFLAADASYDCIRAECPVCWPEREWDGDVEDFVQRVLAGEEIDEGDLYRRVATGEISEEEFEKQWAAEWEVEEGVEGVGDSIAEQSELDKAVCEEIEDVCDSGAKQPGPGQAVCEAEATRITSAQLHEMALSRTAVAAGWDKFLPGTPANQVDWDYVNRICGYSDSDSSEDEWSEVELQSDA